MNNLLPFASDYMEGAHPEILRCLERNNFTPMTGYGTDPICTDAKEKFYLPAAVMMERYFSSPEELRQMLSLLTQFYVESTALLLQTPDISAFTKQGQ